MEGDIRRSATFVALLALLVACDGGSTGTTIGNTGPNADCVANATAAGVSQARGAFPDDPDVHWTPVARDMTDEGYADVELTPDPAQVGAPSFRFYSACNGEDVALLAVFARSGEGWELLLITDAANGIDFTPPTD